MKWWYGASIVCGAAPMIVGVGVFLAWLAVRAEWLELVGLVTLGIGPAVVAVGAVCLLIYVLARRKLPPDRRGGWLRPIAAGALLLANFPVAAAVFSAAWAIETRYVVEIRNAAPVAARSVVLTGSGVETSFGDIPPGGQAKRGFHIRHDGELTLTAVLGDQPIETVIDEYVTNNLGAHKVVTIGPGGEVRVVDAGDR